ncbi:MULTISPECIES: SdiA-regulated domain-containing protein [Calothrix]|uniref:SdiA-regulated domain-containing protein n=2 Tax=Calothrix TaxID=1186 RepID=A0ABR8A4V1_9CYAN|nr:MULTISPECIES: SdiA-regulated domain-containing protein [Calothrix]MBD2194976.1 SdiA-regulated domain-containing protein [Calothrix parietina FACHB-288]MBD2223574.1 SdiA-regulated domain-containing protein [Calothrix anomala FACHB-343]
MATSQYFRIEEFPNSINTVFDSKFNRWLALENSSVLVEVKTKNGELDLTTLKRTNISQLALKNPYGMAIHPITGSLVILDRTTQPQIYQIQPDSLGNFPNTSTTPITLPANLPDLSGIKVNSANGNFVVDSATGQIQYEFTSAGKIAVERDLSGLGLNNQQTLLTNNTSISTFSANTTDASLMTAQMVQTTSIPNPILVQTIYTSTFAPPSPDPSGIVYISHLGSLLISDGEVDEMPLIFQGKNMFQVSLTGTLERGLSTMNYSNEPTGIAYNPANRFLYIADDNKQRVFQINPGGDGTYNTSDDVVSSFSTLPWSSTDPEDIAYSTTSGTLFLVGGVSDTVYQVTTNGTLISQFSTLSFGLHDPEGIAIDPNSGNLFMVGFPANLVFEVSTTGQLIRTYDISAANALKPAGITFAPSSQNPYELSFYIVDRAVDNDTDPNENDGKIYEFALGTPVPNQAPAVTAGETQVVLYSANLDGAVADDGLPQGGTVTATWSFISGPGEVIFDDPSVEDTGVSFTTPGTYTLQLSASDGELTASSQTTIQVLDPTSTTFVSFGSSGTIGGVSFNRQDILAHDQSTGNWYMYFDGSDMGFGSSYLRDFHINADGSILFALNNPTILPGQLSVDDSDIVKFTPTTTGDFTSGTLEMYFDGSDVGLTSDAEELDAIAIDRDGNLVVSTRGGFTVPGVSGSDEDLMKFTATSLGQNTSGTWTMLFDGSDVGLTDSSEDVLGVWFDANSNKIFLTTEGNFRVNGTSGDGSDIFVFNPTSLGSNTSGSFTPYWDGSNNGVPAGIAVEGIAIAPIF